MFRINLCNLFVLSFDLTCVLMLELNRVKGMGLKCSSGPFGYVQKTTRLVWLVVVGKLDESNKSLLLKRNWYLI